MCTAFTLRRRDGTQLFGRTLDWHESFGERILRTPRGLALGTGRGKEHPFPAVLPPMTRYAMLGAGAATGEDFPLYADALNERGLCMAGLRFAEGAHYLSPDAALPHRFVGLAPWELIPCVLGLCADVEEANTLLARVRVVDLPYLSPAGEVIPTAPLHWMIADGRDALVVEATARGLEIHDAPLGVMTNDPPYGEQMAAWERFSRRGDTPPADYTSTARLIRAAALKRRAEKLLAGKEREDPVACFFLVAGTVSPPEGVTPAVTGEGWQTTRYTCCMDGARGRYYYTTAEMPRIRKETLARS